MNGYIFCLKSDESDSIGWQYLQAHKERLVKMSFEESSIDLASTVTPRFVVDNLVYEMVRQYFVHKSDTDTERIILLKPLLQANENGDYYKTLTRRPLIYTGANSYTQRKMEKNNKDNNESTD